MNNTIGHQKLVDGVLFAFGSRKDVRIWKQVTGVFKSDSRTIRVGLNGAADLTGIVLGGRRLEVEIKTGRAVQSDDQKKFQKMIESYGGIYIVARDINSALAELDSKM